MKVHATLPVQQVETVRRKTGEAQSSASQPGSDQIQVSGEAQFISELRQAATDLPPVRADAVEQARADIASGRLGSEEDLNAAVDALLAGF